MEKVSVSEFKAKCLGLFERVRKTGESLVITKRGEPIAVIHPAPPKEGRKSSFGCMKGKAEILGDITEPLGTEDWEVFKE